jgi:hydrogenase nickel incorporation protein HypA/HybF
MHELSLAENMLEIIQDRAKSEHFENVTKVTLEIGKLSHVEADAMAFCFDAVMAGTIAGKAKLEIIQTEGMGKCRQCEHTNLIAHFYDPCANCGEFGLKIVQGDQIRIKYLEVV